MKKYIAVAVCAAACLTSCSREESFESLSARVFDTAAAQCLAMEQALSADTFPRTLDEGGNLVVSPVKWWCSGFFPGTLWLVYDYTGDEEIKAAAIRQTAKVEPIKYVTNDHDVGFQINCSFGSGYRLTEEPAYREVMHTAAHSLATRFNPQVGCLRSWDFVREGCDWKFPVIIDNMMNLELLLRVSQMYGEESLKEIALSHARTTAANHFREDFTTWHLVDYDPSDGSVRGRQTVQGYADSSAWGRGQAWALYGYTMMYELTGGEEFLDLACNIARMLLERLPQDGIPYWDFDDPAVPSALRDASAGAVMASAFALLGSFPIDGALAARCREMSLRQIRTLASEEYLARPGENGCFLLRHSVGNLPGGQEVDVPLTYADYYFLESILRYGTLYVK